MTPADMRNDQFPLHEAFTLLYVGDYFADTLEFSVREHRTLRLMLLQLWTEDEAAGDDDPALARAAGLTPEEWENCKPAIIPLLADLKPRIATKLKQLSAYDGQRLPSSDWEIIRAIVLERDNHTCAYCGLRASNLETDHIIPLARSGSNRFKN